MIKKAALAAVLAASSSFAAWDLFPVQDAGKGEVRLKYGNSWLDGGDDDRTIGTVILGARYTLIQNLELGLSMPYYPYVYENGSDTHLDGLGDLVAHVRYQFVPNMNAFLDVSFPTGEWSEDERFAFDVGAQYSQKFGMVDFGSQLGVSFETEGENKYRGPLRMFLGAEADFLMGGMFTPFVGGNFSMEMGHAHVDGKSVGESHTGDFSAGVKLGGILDLSPNFSIRAEGGFYLGGDALFDDPNFTASISFSYKF